MHYSKNMSSANGKINCYFANWHSIKMLGAYEAHNLIRYLSGWMTLSSINSFWMLSESMLVATSHPPLFSRIRKIVPLRSIEQMILPAARRKVATMKRLNPIWNFSISDNQHKAMAQELFAESFDVVHSISSRQPPRCPNPTIPFWSMAGSFVHMRPKSLYFCYAEFAHRLTPPLGRVGWLHGVSALRGLSYFTPNHGFRGGF